MINNRDECINEKDMINGNICRMFLTHDMDELDDMLLYAELRLKQIYLYHKRRLESEN